MERICFLSDNYIDEMGGEQRVLVNIINMLADSFKIDLYCRFRTVKKSYYQIDKSINLIDIAMYSTIKSENMLSKGLRWLNFRTAILDFFHLKNVMKNIKYSKKMALPWIELLNKNNYKSIIGLSCFWGMFLMLYGNEIKAKCYTWFHSTYDAYFNTKKKYLCGYKSLLENKKVQIEKLIVLTEQDRRIYQEIYHIPTVVIPNPLSFESLEKTALHEKKMLFVGRLLRETKGLDLLVSILKLVFLQNEDWQIDIIGDGTDMSFLKNTIKEMKWENRVHLLGEKKNIKEYYLRSSIFLLTSRWEGFGLVATEAMECGLPIVSFATSGPSEIISDAVDGFLVEKYDIASFAEKVLYLINHESVRFQMGNHAAIKAKRYSKENIRKMWLKLLTD